MEQLNGTIWDFMKYDKVKVVFETVLSMIFTNDYLISKNYFSDSFRKKLTEHNDSFKVSYTDAESWKEATVLNYKKDHTTGYLDLIGYPRGNFVYLYTHNLLISLKMKRFPFRFLSMPLFNDLTDESTVIFDKYVEDFLDDVEVLHKVIFSEVEVDEKDLVSNLEKILVKFYDCIGDKNERFFLALLGIRTTPGSIADLPPLETFLKSTFNDLHTKPTTDGNNKGKGSILTVGARALTKHTHRSGEQFWPLNKGTEKEKNAKAESLLNLFFNEVVWLNLHMLPHNIPIIELRIEKGYGLRWQTDGFFRGFLEPQMEDGHEKGWKH